MCNKELQDHSAWQGWPRWKKKFKNIEIQKFRIVLSLFWILSKKTHCFTLPSYKVERLYFYLKMAMKIIFSLSFRCTAHCSVPARTICRVSEISSGLWNSMARVPPHWLGCRYYICIGFGLEVPSPDIGTNTVILQPEKSIT